MRYFSMFSGIGGFEKDFEDKDIRCVDCGDTFIFSTGEQVFFISKKLSEPKRCPACRNYRRVMVVVPRGGA